ncbi:MAG: BtpA/SgcQ family protein [Phycisphaeraceae bacterium]|nr:BtpA/SgcQ family protein [Phycisphaerales bacterium]MCB9860419.1 BtpA/SgcQ family protein [Phycisphaeraceae bacterium]
MVHVHATPGSPHATMPVDQIVDRAVQDAKAIRDAGFNAIAIENMHDRPYLNIHTPVVTAVMTRVAFAIREVIGDMPLGVQVLSRGEKEAMAVCLAAGGSFIRCENFAYAHIADEGLMIEASAGDLLRYRKSVGAENIQIFADVKKKHACHAITSDLSLAEAAHGMEFFGADGIIVTGAATGKQTNVSDIQEARNAVDVPVLVGSGATPETLGALFEHADGVIVGSWIKRDGFWENDVDEARAREMVRARDALR